MMVFLVFYKNIFSLYTNYFAESEWGIIVAIIRQILYFESNPLSILVIMIGIGFVGGIISRNKIDGIYSALFTGITISITWLVLVFRFTPGYWGFSMKIYDIFEIIIRGLIIGLVLSGPCFTGGLIISYKSKNREEQRPIKIEVSCPYCKRVFKSNPVYCCYCNKKIINN